MLKKINYMNIFKSLFLGIFVGAVVIAYLNGYESAQVSMLQLLLSGVAGLLIGAVTEIITSLLPIDIAKTSTFFFINNMVAIITTVFILFVTFTIIGENMKEVSLEILIISCIIIAIANVIDYLMYKNTNRKLQDYQKKNNLTND